MQKEVSSPQTKYIPLNVHSLINYRDVLYYIPLATTSSQIVRKKKKKEERKKILTGFTVRAFPVFQGHFLDCTMPTELIR